MIPLFLADEFMPRVSKSLRLVWLACCSVLLISTLGCGTSVYNDLVSRKAVYLRSAKKFHGLYAPAVIPGTPMTIRVPLAFGQSYQTGSIHRDDNGPIKPDRLQPPFLPIPGFKLCYEGISPEEAGGKFPFYCYIGALPAQDGDADKLADQVLAKLTETFKDAPAEWEQIDTDTPTGKSLHWRRVRVIGPQTFWVKRGGKLAEETVPGIFEIWLHDATDYVVFVGWRTPQAIDTPETAPADPNAGALAALAGPRKPDLANMPAKAAGTLARDAPTLPAN